MADGDDEPSIDWEAICKSADKKILGWAKFREFQREGNAFLKIGASVKANDNEVIPQHIVEALRESGVKVTVEHLEIFVKGLYGFCRRRLSCMRKIA